jgi:hypothetical protein
LRKVLLWRVLQPNSPSDCSKYYQSSTLVVYSSAWHAGRALSCTSKTSLRRHGNGPMESAPEWAPSSRTTRTKPTRTKTTALRRPSRRPARQRVAEDKRTIRSTRLRAGAIGRAPPRRGANPGGTPTIMTATSRRPKRFHTTLLAPHTAPPYGKPLPGKVTIYAPLPSRVLVRAGATRPWRATGGGHRRPTRSPSNPPPGPAHPRPRPALPRPLHAPLYRQTRL